MARGSIQVKIEGQYDDKDLNRAIKDLQRLKSESGSGSGSVDGMSKSLKGLAVAAGAFVSVSAVTDFMKDAIQQGSALEESLSKVGVVFGTSAADIRAWSEDSAEAFGQSQQSALEAVGTFGNLFQAFGVGQGHAKDMSKSLVVLASDLASFNNTSVEDAITALRSGLSGETEPLKRYGVALTDARLKTEALALGLYSGKGALDANAKSQAAYALIMKDSTLAQGDFQRTADGFANTMRTLQAEVDNAKASIGVALIDAVENAAEAFGGSGGLASGIQSASDQAVIIIEKFSGLIGLLGDLKTAADDLPEWMKGGDGDFLKSAGMNINPFVGAFNHLTDALGLAGMLGDAWNITQLQMSDVAPSATNQYVRMAPALTKVAEATVETKDAAQMAAEAFAAWQQDIKGLLATISNSQSMDDFRKSLADLDATLKGNARNFKGMGDAAKENRDTLRGAFADAADIAQKWAEDNGKSAEQAQRYYDRLGAKIVDQFVKDGFKRKDVTAFLGEEGVWTGPASDRMKAVGTKASIAAFAAGKEIGRDLALGSIAGLASQSAGVQASAMRLIAQAEAAARAAAESNSPSKLFARVGKDLTLGLVEGVREGGDDVRATLQTTYKEWFTSTKATLKDGLDAAKQEFRDFSASISSAIMEGIDFGAAAPQFDEAGNRVGGTFIESLKAQAQKAKDFAAQVKQLVVMGLSQDALQMVLAAGQQAGTAIATELITGGATTIAQTNEIVASTQKAADDAGLMSAKNFYGAGVASAQKTYEGFKDNFGKDGPAYNAMQGIMDRLAASMKRETTITVTTVNRLVSEVISGKRAAGGPVTAGKAYLVGEKGPELFVPNSESGTIIPNGALPSASGSGAAEGLGGGRVYNITVQTGVGDPRQIGQQVVEYIKKFEQTNGAAWRAA